jgi:hypothetical protein
MVSLVAWEPIFGMPTEYCPFRRSHEGDTAVAESFEKRHANTLVWRIEYKLNDRYHI